MGTAYVTAAGFGLVGVTLFTDAGYLDWLAVESYAEGVVPNDIVEVSRRIEAAEH